jgi:hypothetical protein
VAFYAVIRVGFPVIGLIMGLAGAGYANVTGPQPGSSGPGGPPGGEPEPVQDRPAGGRLTDGDARTALRAS